jgi:hypothetical protein
MALAAIKKGLILRSALEGIPVSQTKFKEIRGDNWQAAGLETTCLL